jgi:hypothetical protein
LMFMKRNAAILPLRPVNVKRRPRLDSLRRLEYTVEGATRG